MRCTQADFTSLIRLATAAYVVSLVLMMAAATSVAQASSPENATLQPPLPIELTYDEHLRARGFPSPALRVTVGEISAVLLVDTGAGVHTLASWFVHDAGIQGSESTVSAQDSTGRDVAMRVARRVTFKLAAGRELLLQEAAVTDFPPVFQELRIAGLLSPQLLADSGTIAVLDLRVPSLQVTSEDAAARELNPANARLNSVCRVDTSAFRNLLFGVHTRIAETHALLTLDTGATTTILDATRSVAKNLVALQHDGYQTGVGGAREPIFRSAPLSIDFGAGTRELAVRVGSPHGGCGPDGLLGMDALQGCVVAMSYRSVGLTCDPLPRTAPSPH